jgi:c-di-GMP-binding flagellar brake protein YcgR
MEPVNWLKQWLSRPTERRGAVRNASPGIVAYYWNGSAPLAHEIKDISSTGLYIYTTSRWYLGTVISLVLQAKPEMQAKASTESVSVHSKVVRHGVDGVGVRFVGTDPQERKNLTRFLEEYGYKSKGR